MLKKIKKDIVEAGQLAMALYAGGSIAWTTVCVINNILELYFRELESQLWGSFSFCISKLKKGGIT